MRTVRITTAALFLAASSLLLAQDTTRGFEIVSIKRNTTARGRAVPGVFPGRLFVEALTLRELIVAAFRTPGSELVIDGPSWIDTDLFEIDARARNAVQVGMAMLQPVLIDRFKLRVRHEVRERPIFQLLLVDSNRKVGPRLTPSTCRAGGTNRPGEAGGASSAPAGGGAQEQRECAPIRLAGGPSMTGEGVTISELAERLAAFPVVNRAVRDSTGLAGRFDFHIQWVPGAPGADVSAGPDLFAALRDQLGLRLEQTTARIEVVVVEGAQPLVEN